MSNKKSSSNYSTPPLRNNRRKNGEGSVYLRSDGRWAASVSTGGGSRKHYFGKSAEEVVDKLTQAREQQRKHLPFASEKLTVGQWLDTWLENCRPPATKPKTWINYELFTRLHLKPQLGHIPLVKLEPQHVRNFMGGRLDAGLSARTVRHLRNTLRAALNQAINDARLHRNAAALVEPPEVGDRALDVYNIEEAQRLIAVAQGTRLEALIVAGVGLGLRAGECLGLRWSSVDLARGTVLIQHSLARVHRVRRGDIIKEGESKTERLLGTPKGKKIHQLHLPEILIDAFRRHRVRQDELRLLAGPKWKETGHVFTSSVGTPLEARRMDIEYKKIVDAAGLRRIRFHDLRHSCASILIASGLNPKQVQELLRHSSIQLTLDVYSHLFDSARRETATVMNALLTPKPEPIAVRTAVRPRLTLVK